MNRDGSDQRLLSSTPVLPSRVPAITRVEAATVPDNFDTAQKAGFDFEDITPFGSAPEFPDISAIPSNDSSTTENSGAALGLELELNRMWNDNGDIGGDGCL
jgi:hypothetical protein